MEKGGLSGVSFYRVGKQRATGSCSGGAVPSFKGMCGNVLAELLGEGKREDQRFGLIKMERVPQAMALRWCAVTWLVCLMCDFMSMPHFFAFIRDQCCLCQSRGCIPTHDFMVVMIFVIAL